MGDPFTVRSKGEGGKMPGKQQRAAIASKDHN